MKPACMILADRNQTVLRSLKNLLEPEFEVASMADNVLSLVDAAEALHPDLAIMDLSMHGPGEINLVRHFANRFPDVKIIVLGEDDNPVVVREALALGGSGYVLKRLAVTDLIPAVKAVVRGEEYVSPGCDLDDTQDSPRPGKKG
jgi:DNA-binding NarL/FixJ family response regulator